MFSTDFIFRQQENLELEMSGWIQATMQQNTIITGQEEKETL